MDDVNKTFLTPSTANIQESELLDYGLDTAKLMARRISHDFNNLIAVVRGYASVLQGRPELDEDTKELIGFIDQAGSELAVLTERMAQFAENQRHERSWINLNSAIVEFLQEARDQVPQEIEVETQLGSNNMPDIWGNARLIGELCHKLWQNAIDSMPHGGRLSLKLSIHHDNGLGGHGKTSMRHADSVGVDGTSNREDGQDETRTNKRGPAACILLRVTDTGEGMDEQTRASMLRPFFTTKPGKCRGLGATAVYETVKFHGGRLYVSSEPDKGTSVEIHLPVAGSTQPQPVGGSGEAEDTPGSFLLVVDDDDMVRMATQRMLAHLGYDSIPAPSGEEALTLYEASRVVISAVILDVTMPGIGGLETFLRLRAMNSQVKIILVTGDPGSRAVREIEELGVSYLIGKPFQIEELSLAVLRALE